MTRYFFHVHDGPHEHIDKLGEELPDRRAAWNEATGARADIRSRGANRESDRFREAQRRS